MRTKAPKIESKKTVVTLRHEEATRKYIPTAEYQPVMEPEQLSPIRVAYERRNRDLDPQLVWRGKDEQDWSDLVVPAPPLYIQEKVHPKVIVDDLLRRNQTDRKTAGQQEQPDDPGRQPAGDGVARRARRAARPGAMYLY
jgi:adenine-specific DNA-methyltransferase